MLATAARITNVGNHPILDPLLSARNEKQRNENVILGLFQQNLTNFRSLLTNTSVLFFHVETISRAFAFKASPFVLTVASITLTS